MEQGRIFLAIALSFLIFLVWNLFFVQKKPPRQKPDVEATQKVKPEAAPQRHAKSSPAGALPSQASPPAPAAPVEAGRLLTVETPLYTLRLSEGKGTVKRFTLKHYRERVEKDSPPKTLITEKNPFGTVHIGFEQQSVAGFESAVFSSDAPQDTIRLGDTDKTITFTWRSPGGMVIEKQYTFSPKTYLINLTVTLRNAGEKAWKDDVALSLYRYMGKHKRGRFGFEGPSALINGDVQEVAIKKIKDKPLPVGAVKWWAVEDRYFITAAIPPENDQGEVMFFARPNGIVEARFILPSVALKPHAEKRLDYHLFFGPKSMKILKEVGYDLEETVNFGMFDFIAKPCVWLMNQIYRVIPNYGVAIIILTILSKVLLWPLGNKSYKSMSDMKKLQPLMKEIREKYKEDKKRQQQEIMNLYRTYKINPLGGCLPMVAQIPVFFALYRMLYEAIELRHAPFFGWINDLSAPDRLFRFGFSIPFMQPPYGIPVLTLVMGATMLLQQKMSPPPGDPGQAKMMMLMPIVFTVIFINFSSGLVLYWLVNNLLSIGQQYYVSKKSS